MARSRKVIVNLDEKKLAFLVIVIRLKILPLQTEQKGIRARNKLL